MPNLQNCECRCRGCDACKKATRRWEHCGSHLSSCHLECPR